MEEDFMCPIFLPIGFPFAKGICKWSAFSQGAESGALSKLFKRGEIGLVRNAM
jgi:hypothetical protein